MRKLDASVYHEDGSRETLPFLNLDRFAFIIPDDPI